MEVKNMIQNSKPRMRLSRGLAIAATAAAVLTVSAFAASGFLHYENPSAMLRAFFGENVPSNSEGIVDVDENGKLMWALPAWERVPVDETLADELISPHISAVGESAVMDGYTVTVEANLYDPTIKAGLLYYTVENPNGLGTYLLSPDGRISWTDDSDIVTWTSIPQETFLDSATSSDTSLSLCAYYINDAAWSGVDFALNIRDKDMTQQKEIKLPLNSSGGSLPTASLAGGAVTVSPIGIRIDRTHFDMEDGTNFHQIILHYANGSSYILRDDDAFVKNATYSLMGASNMETHTFNRIVDTSQITSVTIEGVDCTRDS